MAAVMTSEAHIDDRTGPTPDYRRLQDEKEVLAEGYRPEPKQFSAVAVPPDAAPDERAVPRRRLDERQTGEDSVPVSTSRRLPRRWSPSR